MNNTKKMVLSAVIAGTLLTPVLANADTSSLSSMTLSTIEEGTNKVNLKLEQTNSIVKSFQVILKVDGAKISSIEWSSRIKDTGNASYVDISDNEVMIFVTSTVNLVDENRNLEIGTVTVKGNVGDQYKVSVSNLKTVSLNNKKSSAEIINNTSNVDFYVGESGIKDDTNDNNDTVKPPANNEESKDDENIEVKPPADNDVSKDEDTIETPGTNDGGNEVKPGTNETIKGDENIEESESDNIKTENAVENISSVVEKVKKVATGDNIKYIIALASAMVIALAGIFAFRGKRNK